MCEHSEFIAASLNNLQILNKQTNNEYIHSRPTAHPEHQKTGDRRKILISLYRSNRWKFRKQI